MHRAACLEQLCRQLDQLYPMRSKAWDYTPPEYERDGLALGIDITRDPWEPFPLEQLEEDPRVVTYLDEGDYVRLLVDVRDAENCRLWKVI